VLERLTVADVMTPDVMTLTPEDPILDAAREMVRSRIHRLVVVGPGQRVVGILSTLDLLEAFSAEE
jgi:CBS domain-containing protein